MTTTQIVTSKEVSQQLADAGVEHETLFEWRGIMADVDRMNWRVVKKKNDRNPAKYPAFTASELMELLPWSTDLYKLNQKSDDFVKWTKKYCCSYQVPGGAKYGDHQLKRLNYRSNSPADALGRLLIYLTKEGLV